MECGDFLRDCLAQICNETVSVESNHDLNVKKDLNKGGNVNNGANGNEKEGGDITSKASTVACNDGMDIKSLFHVSLEWKFECEACHRFIVIHLKVQLIDT